MNEQMKEDGNHAVEKGDGDDDDEVVSLLSPFDTLSPIS